MNLDQRKPIHLICPQCGHDFSVNTNKIVKERQFQKDRMASIQKAIAQAKAENVRKNSPRYKRLIAQLEDCKMALQALNNINRNLSENSELEKNKIFYGLVKKELGLEKAIALMEEAEDTMVYRDYDMAIQKFNNFQGS